MKNPKYKELAPNDIVEFDIGDGYHMAGTQAINVKVIEYADNDEQEEVS